jgi:hypothetical protein
MNRTSSEIAQQYPDGAMRHICVARITKPVRDYKDHFHVLRLLSQTARTTNTQLILKHYTIEKENSIYLIDTWVGEIYYSLYYLKIAF